MSYVLIYSIIIGNLQYLLMEPMQNLAQCRRLLPIIQSSELVTDAKCAAVILDKEKEDE